MTDHSSGHEPNLDARRVADAPTATRSAAADAARGHAHEHAFVRERVVGATNSVAGQVPSELAATATPEPVRRTGVPEPELDRIIIRRMHARGHHGVFEHERRDGQDFYVDAEAWVDAAAASSSDHIGDTLHYGEWMHALHAIVTGEPVDLIETLAERLAAATFGFDDAAAVRITVHKPQAPVALDFEDVAVSILRHRPAAPGEYLESAAAHAVQAPSAQTAATAVPATVPAAAPSTAASASAEDDFLAREAAAAAHTASDASIVLDSGGAPNVPLPRIEPAGDLFSPIAQREQDERSPSDAAVVSRAGGAPNATSAQLPTRVRQAVIALGANLGDRDATLSSALRSISELPGTKLVAASSLYETPALTLEGVSEEAPAYRNAVVLVDTDLPAEDLLQALHAIEDAHGRTRETRWGSRTLDLDLIQVSGELRDGALQLPHPRAHERAFVLAPWLEVDPRAQLAPHGSVAELRAAAPDRVDRIVQ
ncbi:2-amino-4-hydroxy-6-hydroxymethyldihydropteridine diphosphokinase [Pseudoclavibacter sp. RFBB5]|uniref:2-amino-4-hydroxy-6- hydroxymethyldihydropteridine diphosphokinase n=1 Tax=Pseudoclavibacter sp. RFBB5 TaxID=2080574 RepID=UPI0015E1BD1F|nr:2-amino-4-hydroxy-6-hydroxymethyldihydropteridine diphosphokinase [Pseudoclavibacter sp. RFBB5]